MGFEKHIVFQGYFIMDNSKSNDIRFIAGIVLLVVLGTSSSFAFARLMGKNLVAYHCDLEVTLKEDVTVIDTNKAVITAISSSDEDNTDDCKVYLPAGTTGYSHLVIWYYNYLKINVSDLYLSATFNYSDNESVNVYISNNQEKQQYDNYIDISMLESPESVISEYKDSIETYKKMWLSHQIKGTVIGLIISVVIAAVFILIHKNQIEKKTPSILFVVLVVIDVILLLNTVAFLYFFSRVL